MAHALPDLLIDRSLGLVAVPAFFRGAWPSAVRTIDDVYGRGKVEDQVWMQDADAEGWVAICKDDRIRRRVGERKLMSGGTLRVFCLVGGQLRSSVQVKRFSTLLEDLKVQSVEPGPWMFGVYAGHIEALTLYK
jgi:hypothetical protein